VRDVSKIVSVTRADVARAQLVMKLNDSLGRTTSPGIQKIAAAHSASSGQALGENGDSRPNGH
jgi:hypothetical protein